MFGYVSGGYAQIIESIKNKLIVEDVAIKANHEAIEIKSGIDNRPMVTFSNSHCETFDNIIVMLPSDVSADLCKDLLNNLRRIYSLLIK